MATIFCRGFTLFILVLLITLSSINTSTLGDTDKVVVDIENGLPSDSKEPLRLSCAKGSLELKVGDHYNLTVKSQQAVECSAQWIPFFATWNAYNAESDKPHIIGKTIFWRLFKNGFYRSWDNRSNWSKIMDWQSE